MFGDKSAINPGGIRIGTPALTTRGFDENDFVKVGEFIDKAVNLCIKIQDKSGKKLTDFKNMSSNDPELKKDIEKLREDVEMFASKFDFTEFTE